MSNRSSSTASTQKAAVFLDRDGTIIEEVGYLDNIAQLKLIPGAARAIGLFNKAGIPVIMITNQSGVARGYFSESLVQNLHQRLLEILAAESAYLDAIYYCPHHPTAGKPPYRRKCNCRKPNPGMVEQAIEDLHLGKRRFFVVGDKNVDMELAGRTGAEGILVLTGHGREEKKQPAGTGKKQPAYIATDLLQAAEWILSQLTIHSQQEDKMMVNQELLDILVCPQCKEKIILSSDQHWLICNHCRLQYPIRDDIPIMLIDEAKPLATKTA